MKRADEYLVLSIVAIFYAFSIATWSFNGTWGDCCNLYLQPVAQHFFAPTFTEIIFSLLENVNSNIVLVAFFQILLPVINFVLVYQIMIQLVSWRWSLTLSLLGASFIPDYAFREFIVDLITLNQPTLPTSPPTAIHYPLPNIALFFFLLGFIFASQKTFYSISRASMVTGFLALLMYIHALGAAFLICFWLVRYSVRCFRQGAKAQRIFIHLSVQVFLFVIVSLPGLQSLNTATVELADSAVSIYYFLAYLFVPLLLLATVSRIMKVDVKEIWFRFSSIYALLLLELSFLSIDILGLFPINFDYLSQGVGQSLLHQLYFAPCICFISRSSSGHKSSIFKNELEKSVSHRIETVFEFAERYLLQCIIALLLVYNLKWVYS